MRTPAERRTAPDVASGAVSIPAIAPRLQAAAFWRAVGAEALATLRTWSR